MPLDQARLSTAIYAAWTADPNNGFISPLNVHAEQTIKSLCDAVATAVVAEISGHAQLTIRSGTFGDSGLQQYVNSSSAVVSTGAPASDVTLPEGRIT